MPAGTPEEKDAFSRALGEELPAFLNWLNQVVVPPELADSRTGIKAWQDSKLLEAVSEISPERRMENLISLAVSKGGSEIAIGEAVWMSATEVQSMLQDRDSPTSQQASSLLKFDVSAGRYLSTLCKNSSRFVTDSKLTSGTRRYKITRPLPD